MESCTWESQSDNIVVQIIFPEGKTDSLFGNYLYMMDANKKITIDSVPDKGDKVVFNRKWDSAFIPFMVSVAMLDTVNGVPYFRPLGFANPYATKSIYSFFLSR